jgi:two-component system phosphate regulon sensor histidine kinase PhoR
MIPIIARSGGLGGVALKDQRCFVWAVTIAVVVALGVAALTELLSPNSAAAGRRRLVADGIAAVGVICLGWAAGRSAATVTSIARQLAPGQARPQGDSAQNDGAAVVGRTRAALGDRDERIRELEAQVVDLSLRCRLADRRERQTEAIIYSLRDAVLVIDESDRLLMANEAASGLFGFDQAKARHQPVGALLGPAHKEFVELLHRSRHGGIEATRREMTFPGAEAPRIFDTIVSCVREGERVCGVVAVLHDVTREKEVAQMKNDFVSHVSHELKTPLASITAYSEMLADGEADDEQTRKEFYAVIQSQAQRLNRLIEDILNISRIESGLVKVHKEPVSLTILIEQQMQMIQGFAQEKDITVTRPEPIVFDQVYADKDMISQVIVNLLSNAVKYTPSGGSVRIAVEVNEAEKLARVTVTDTGVGIPPDEVDHVFDKFYRVKANNKQAKGTGLGLNLVKQIVEKTHNGRIFVTSQVGVGSTFGFELPLATPEMVEVA